MHRPTSRSLRRTPTSRSCRWRRPASPGRCSPSGWANDPVAFAAGVEWRSMSGLVHPRYGAWPRATWSASTPASRPRAAYDAKEAFAELRIPIIQDGFIHRLELSGAARYSDYSLDAVGGVWTYSAGVEFAPIQDIAFRGQYQRAIRAPNVCELFGGTPVGFPPATDPCRWRPPLPMRPIRRYSASPPACRRRASAPARPPAERPDSGRVRRQPESSGRGRRHLDGRRGAPSALHPAAQHHGRLLQHRDRQRDRRGRRRREQHPEPLLQRDPGCELRDLPA